MKKVFALMFSCILLFSCIVPAMAEGRALPTKRCPMCNAMFRYITTRTYAHDESFPCTHGKTGMDYYKVYEVKEYGVCDNCDYVYSYECDEHVFYLCAGT